ncbi:MAG: hypothetical protein ACREKH_22115 [Candidatus Rokuibacteriota bacterium]
MRRRRDRHSDFGIDLFPFLMVLLCSLATQGVALAAQFALAPLVHRIATAAADRQSVAIHRVVVTRERWTIPERELVLAAPLDGASTGAPVVTGTMDRWKAELEALAGTLLQQAGPTVPVVEVEFDRFSVADLRYTLDILDQFLEDRKTPTDRRRLNIRYRPLKAAR